MTSLRTGAATLVGQVRTANEDAFLANEELAVVADGMGGHRAGEVASAATIDVLRNAQGGRSVEDLVAAVHRANRRVNEEAAEDDELRGMGTTVCVVGVVRYDGAEQLAVLNVGDSRVYLLADGVLTRLTEDHSLVETLLREGRISPEEAEVHPQRNVITRALGVEALVVVDAWLLRPCDDDRLLLCSDGLFGELSEERIAELLSEPDDVEVVARRLAAEEEAAGGRDNITAVVLDVSESGQDPAPIHDRYRRITTPAVDLSDPDEDGPRTDTVLVVVAPADNGAGVDDADEGDVETDSDGDEQRTDAATEPPGTGSEAASSGTRPITQRASRWRTALFLVAILGVIVISLGVLVVASRTGWFVGQDAGRVAVFQGRRDGVLWIGPRLVQRSDLRVEDLTDADRKKVAQGVDVPSESKGQDYVARLKSSLSTTTTSTTTTVPTTTVPTTTVPTTTVPTTTVPTAPVPPSTP